MMTISQQEALAAIRYGYGVKPGESPPKDGASLLDQVAAHHRAPERHDLPGWEERLQLMRARRKMRADERMGRTVENADDLDRAFRRLRAGDLAQFVRRPVLSRRGFVERLSAFWADHFTVAATNMQVGIMIPDYHERAIRPHIGGYFADMLYAVVTHPAMLAYLDQSASVGPNSRAGRRRGRGINENLARELLELHTMGVGAGYAQTDVRELAELLTGLRITPNGFDYASNWAEPGPEQVLGVRYGPDGGLADIRAALDDLARRPETARHIAGKLARHFISDAPDEALTAHLAAAFTRSGGHLPSLYEALLEHPAAFALPLAKVKQPFEFVVSTVRALGLQDQIRDDLRLLRRGFGGPLLAMGQTPLRPPGPDGWPEEAEAWITPSMLAARIEWAAAVARAHAQDMDPRRFLTATLGPLASKNLRFAAAGAEAKWEGVAVVLVSPEFNRR